MSRSSRRVDRIGSQLRARPPHRHLRDQGCFDPGPETVSRSEYRRLRGIPEPASNDDQQGGRPVGVFRDRLEGYVTEVVKILSEGEIRSDSGIGPILGERVGMAPPMVGAVIGHLSGLNMVEVDRVTHPKGERMVAIRLLPKSKWRSEVPDVKQMIVDAVTEHGPIHDPNGLASNRLLEHVNTPYGATHTRMLIGELVAEGRLVRDIAGKRTFWIGLPDQAHLMPARPQKVVPLRRPDKPKQPAEPEVTPVSEAGGINYRELSDTMLSQVVDYLSGRDGEIEDLRRRIGELEGQLDEYKAEAGRQILRVRQLEEELVEAKKARASGDLGEKERQVVSKFARRLSAGG